ncbi:hypothetical protein BHE74_00031197 [Ensete ventricosum]|nr:hypothetical protein BHE74_00031197 [Ensete ventricosum]
MAIRCLSAPFSPPSAPVSLSHKILVSKAPTLILACGHRSIAVEDKNHRFRSVGKAMVSAEKDLVANEVAKDADGRFFEEFFRSDDFLMACVQAEPFIYICCPKN